MPVLQPRVQFRPVDASGQQFHPQPRGKRVRFGNIYKQELVRLVYKQLLGCLGVRGYKELKPKSSRREVKVLWGRNVRPSQVFRSKLQCV